MYNTPKWKGATKGRKARLLNLYVSLKIFLGVRIYLKKRRRKYLTKSEDSSKI
jgi:hypothetical protein